MRQDYPLSIEEFREIYSKVVRLCIDLVVFSEDKGIFLTLRDIEPCKGTWHMPGGSVLFGESLQEAVKRIAKKELDIDVVDSKFLGYIEFPSHYKNKLDHPVSMVFEANKFSGSIKATEEEATAGNWFKKVPENMHPNQDAWLLEHNFIKK